MDQRRVTRALERGQQLVAGVERIAPGRYLVPSQSVQDGVHLVTVAAGRLQCDCRAFAAGQVCAHRAAAAIWIAFPELEQEQRAGRGEAALVA